VIVPRGSPTRLAGGRIIRRPTRGFRGLTGPAAGFADFASYNTAVCLPQFDATVRCPVPFDPACVNPLNAQLSACQAAWATDPQSCHNVVCDASGNPAVSTGTYTTVHGTVATGPGFNTTTGFVPLPAPATTSMPIKPVFHLPPPASQKPFGYWAGGGTRPPSSTAVLPPGYGTRPIPIQSSSPAAAPGGPSAPPSAPIPVQTQTPPTAGCDPSDPTCISEYQPAPTIGTVLSSIPIWGWGLGVVAIILLMRPGGKR
jgi:hypothetical protein